MKITYDTSVDAVYIYFKNETKAGEAVTTHTLDDKFEFKDIVNVDLDINSTILGIEVLSASTQLPKELLDRAEIIG